MAEYDLRSAAEYLKCQKECQCDHDVGIFSCVGCDVARLANQWLIDHPADDAEPTGFDWLANNLEHIPNRYLGSAYATKRTDFLIPGEDAYSRRLVFIAGASFIRLEETTVPDEDPEDIEESESVIVLPRPETRGELRRLCRALRITFTEKVT